MDLSKNVLKLLKWKAGPSFFYILSAACILLGAAMITIPLYENSNLLAKRFYLVGVLHSYEIALLCVSLLVCRWKKSNKDAISLVCLLGIFIIGSTISLDTVSVEFAQTTLILGIISLLFVFLKLHLLFKKILGNNNILLFIALIILLLPNFIMPGILGLALENGLKNNRQLIPIWSIGWFLTIFAGILFVFTARKVSAQDIVNDKVKPFLSRRVMQWIFSLIVFTGTICHQYTMSFSFDLRISIANVLPLVIVGIFLGFEFKRVLQKKFAIGDLSWILSPVVLAFVVASNQPAQSAYELASYPALLLGVTSAATLFLHFSKRSYIAKYKHFFLYIAAIYFLSAIVVWNNSLVFIWLLRVALLIAFMLMLRYQNFYWAVTVALLSVTNIFVEPQFLHIAQEIRLSYVKVFCLLLGTMTLLLCALVPQKTPKKVLVIASILFAIGIHGCFADANIKDLYAPAISSLGAIFCGGIFSWRYRDFKAFAPTILPAMVNGQTFLYSSGEFLLNNKGWIVIAISFILLALGAMSSFANLDQEEHAQTT
ncbi:hypothetical protein [Candidatus Uabimicrobium amorphum]|uniref:Uncharacterized protein n=1 Tax=Uabimicrobium amorphum TaxID=2596890 RepID=A0A5S9ILW5_UABAM|nr:hypothetical protein [Candidatus Uabimicrobium amorphum]BBM83450.1 hypothetical protein UABAM_01802 [Candidatus Uabimicrobium amorphum]